MQQSMLAGISEVCRLPFHIWWVFCPLRMQSVRHSFRLSLPVVPPAPYALTSIASNASVRIHTTATSDYLDLQGTRSAACRLCRTPHLMASCKWRQPVCEPFYLKFENLLHRKIASIGHFACLALPGGREADGDPHLGAVGILCCPSAGTASHRR